MGWDDGICMYLLIVAKEVSSSHNFELHSLKLTYPLKIGRAPKGNNRILTIHFQVIDVSFREGIWMFLSAEFAAIPSDMA